VPSVRVVAELPFLLRIPPGVQWHLVCNATVRLTLTVSDARESYRLGGGVLEGRSDGTVAMAEVKMLAPGPRSGDEFPATLVTVEFPEAPETWLATQQAPARALMVGGDPFGPLLPMARCAINKLILAYRWVGGDTVNVSIVDELSLPELANLAEVSIAEGTPHHLRHITGLDTTPVGGDQLGAIGEAMADGEFPRTWQKLLLDAELNRSREDLGMALVLASSAAEVFADRVLAERLPGRYVVQDKAFAKFDGQLIHEAWRKYHGPLQAAAGASMCQEAPGLYRDLQDLYHARNAFAHAGRTQYQSADGPTVAIDPGEVGRLVEAARQAIAFATRHLRPNPTS